MKTVIKKLKALFDFLPLPADAFVSRLTAIHDKMLGNTAFPNPPVDLVAFMTAITTFAASVVVALDGSKQAIAIMKKQHEGLVKMAELLGHYVEATCNNDPATLHPAVSLFVRRPAFHRNGLPNRRLYVSIR